jgi:hypothetical protein
MARALRIAGGAGKALRIEDNGLYTFVWTRPGAQGTLPGNE